MCTSLNYEISANSWQHAIASNTLRVEHAATRPREVISEKAINPQTMPIKLAMVIYNGSELFQNLSRLRVVVALGHRVSKYGHRLLRNGTMHMNPMI